MKEYLIDGNNLIGKSRSLSEIQKKDKQASRERLINLIEKFLKDKKIIITIYFDGYENSKIASKVKIKYSNNKSADEVIRKDISNAKNKTNLVVVSSDRDILNYAKVCSCTLISSEIFLSQLIIPPAIQDEENKIKSLSRDNEEFIKLFGE
jgi:predicted RNA-binding protein with PIN domain